MPKSKVELRCDNYEVHGVIDVLTHVTLSQAPDNNLFRQHVQAACENLQGTFEVIVDYKGFGRPTTSDPSWEQGEWQLKTYSWLRKRQPDALPVAAGILIYINELTPGEKEMKDLKRGIRDGTADVMPKKGSRDEQIIRMWQSGTNTDQLSLEFRLRRAIRVIPISDQSLDDALEAFDDVVRRIEEDVVKEANGQNILQSWSPDCSDNDTCVACDFRNFCPKPANSIDGYIIKAPVAP
ncbi:MAG: PD-(D/E)XK nuclease family protein [Chloroflexota bacterium]|nr:PD-(D/E)XK nuclease family protein [Chloroflexota bacterium]